MGSGRESLTGRSAHTVLVIGGYGFFGQRICALLAKDPDIRLLVGGRNGELARAMCVRLGLPADQAVVVDVASADFGAQLGALGVNILVHTAGPFQGQDYSVARAAIDAGVHSVDLADGRAFVEGIGVLDATARARGVAVISGASSLPGLSSAVVDRYRGEFSRLDAIRIGISSGARSPGLATVRGVFSYAGKPLAVWVGGGWRQRVGWRGLRRYRFPAPLGGRLVTWCDVPDLALFPARYSGVRTVTFKAGFASALGQLVVWFGAGLVKRGWMPSLTRWAAPLHRASRWLERFVSHRGGMFVVMEGAGIDGRPRRRTWHLLAAQNHGPTIPCGAAVALVRKLVRGGTVMPGARPCLGELTVEEYLATLQGLDVREVAEHVVSAD